MMNQLNSKTEKHPNIMDFYGCAKNNAGLFIYIELCQGGSLDQKIKRYGKISEDKAINIIKPLVEAMVFMNKKGIIHRDLKP